MSPADYFGSHERLLTDLDVIRERVEHVEALSEITGLTFYWRGQADASWGVHSTLHRGIARRLGIGIDEVTEQEVCNVERYLVLESREWIRPAVGARLTTLDLFARLQHFGIPTRLVDFTRDPLVALYFAVADAEGTDGRLVVAAARGAVSNTLLESFAIPWRSGQDARPSKWNEQLFALDDHADFPRILHQKGVFLVGGTPSTRPQRRTSAGRLLSARDVRTCMSIPLALHSWTQADLAPLVSVEELNGHGGAGPALRARRVGRGCLSERPEVRPVHVQVLEDDELGVGRLGGVEHGALERRERPPD